MMSRFAALALVALSGCSAPPSNEPPPSSAPTVTPEMLKPLTDAYRQFVGELVQLGSPSPRDRADALKKLQAGQYGYFPDDRTLINQAASGDEPARIELVRRGKLLDAMFVFWGQVDLAAWNDARKKIMELGQDARIILVNVLLRMLLNGQLQHQWPQLRFQLVAIGDDAFETAVALFKAKADATPRDAIIFRKDDLVQVALVIMGFGEQGRPVLEEHARSPLFNVRRAIAVALGEGRATEHFGLLDSLLRKDPEWMVRADAADAMGSIRDRARAGAALVEALKTERDRNVRRHIAESLGTLVYKDGVPALISSLDLPDYEYVERAMFALFRITGERFQTSDEWRRWYATKWKPKTK